jgi:MFS family permease
LGVGVCFLVNAASFIAASFIAVVYSLTAMNPRALKPSPPAQRARGQLREGLRYVTSEPRLWVPLLMAAIVGLFAYEFQVTLPVIAKQTFGGNAATYGFLTAAMGLGAVFGGLMTAARGRPGLKTMTIAGTGFGVAMLCVALAPSLAIAFVAMGVTGFAAITFMATGNSTLQLEARPSMRGRVMALWAVGFMGSTPIGGPLIGWVVEAAGARVGIAVGGVSCLVAASIGLFAWRRLGIGEIPRSVLPVADGKYVAQVPVPLVAAEAD